MASTVRERILQRIYTRLLNAFPTQGVYRSRTAAVARKEGTPLVISPLQGQTQAISETEDRNEFAVQIEVIARGDPWDAEADQVIAAVHPFIVRPSDFDGEPLWDEVRTAGGDYQEYDADGDAGSLKQIYRFTYLSARADLTKYVG